MWSGNGRRLRIMFLEFKKAGKMVVGLLSLFCTVTEGSSSYRGGDEMAMKEGMNNPHSFSPIILFSFHCLQNSTLWGMRDAACKTQNRREEDGEWEHKNANQHNTMCIKIILANPKVEQYAFGSLSGMLLATLLCLNPM